MPPTKQSGKQQSNTAGTGFGSSSSSLKSSSKFTSLIQDLKGKSITKTNLTLANKCFAKNNFTGEIGDHRTFDDNVGNTQIVFFGLGQKRKYNPLNLSRSVKGIIDKGEKTLYLAIYNSNNQRSYITVKLK